MLQMFIVIVLIIVCKPFLDYRSKKFRFTHIFWENASWIFISIFNANLGLHRLNFDFIYISLLKILVPNDFNIITYGNNY